MSGRAIRDLMRGVIEKAGTKRVRLARNTICYTNESGETVIRLHDTNIITVSADGWTKTLDTGGWNTVTTRDRLSRFGAEWLADYESTRLTEKESRHAR